MNEELMEKLRGYHLPAQTIGKEETYCDEARANFLNEAISIISAEARKQEREALGNWLASNVKAIGGGEAFWFTNAVEKLQRGQALKEGGKEAE